MKNSNNKLARIVELLRKDTGINNSIEQLSLLLLIKYFYDVASNSQSDICRSSFRGLFSEVNGLGHGKISNDFSIIKSIFHEVIRGNESFFDKCLLGDNSWRNIDVIFNNIPLRIRSLKVLEAALYELEDLDFYEFLSVDFDQLLLSMVKDSSSSGAFHSPKPLVEAMVKVSNPSPQTSIYDPAMGTGRAFVEVEKHLSKTYEDRSFKAIGNDISPFAYLIGILNLLLNGIDIKQISLSDSLLIKDDLKYDLILSGVPFGKASDISKYEYYYNGYTGNLEAMFLKHAMDKLAKNGKAALIVPDGLLFNKANQLDVLRGQLLTQFNLHSILSLPEGVLAPYTGVKVSVLFFENSMPGKDIWFYELNTAKPLNKLNSINDSDFEEFISQFESRSVGENSCLIDKKSLLADETFNLSFSLQKKEEKFSFDKLEKINSLKKDQLALVELIESCFKNASKNIDVEHFTDVAIKSVCDLRSGANLNKSEVLSNGSYPVFGGNGIIGYYEEANRFSGSIVIGKVGMYCGNIHLSPGPHWLTSNAISLEVKDDKSVFTPYLAHLLQSMNLNQIATGTVQKFISIKQLNSIVISLPSYDKQVELSNWFNLLKENKKSIQSLLSEFSKDLELFTENSILEKTLKF
ncbi:N-6 DNA methylase [Pseudoalteromonas shioyasakiensis]|uniref:N-6 DNA methylase n=1 Tax=Pseudoalteromonas shioyasakiensis TaxID=1190813 RepID=UPI002117F273|nr:N-6 DNA methylase [Pseudoalteromonas shioyasakiensis]MCQ8879696.1 N-6 DNA methylase [Pseudoalteromonas shioyasakiensis]